MVEMFAYEKMRWERDPEEEYDLFFGEKRFYLEIPVSELLPIGHFWQDRLRLPENFKKRKAQVYYIPSEPGVLDVEWLRDTGPKNCEELARWIQMAFEEYEVFLKDMPNEVRERIKESIDYSIYGELNEVDVIDLFEKEGIAPFLRLDYVVIAQKTEAFQLCFESMIEAYFTDYGFGVYKEQGNIIFAAHEFSFPDFGEEGNGNS